MIQKSVKINLETPAVLPGKQAPLQNSRRPFKYPWWGRIGIPGAILFLYYSALQRLGFKMKNRLCPIGFKGIRFPFYARFGASDAAVFHQIFVEREYSCLDNVNDAKFILDCGANVGYSALWFLHRYPRASVMAVEPDRKNFELCRKNLLPYAPRVSLVHAAIWPCKTGLTVTAGKGGREWAFQVRECSPWENPDLYGVQIHDLLRDSGFESIDILKIDIETAEKMLFARNYEPWLDKVKNIVIELHDEECEEVFFRALSSYNYILSRSGELTVCKKILPRTIPPRPYPQAKIHAQEMKAARM